MDVTASASPRQLARAAGALYLVNIVLGGLPVLPGEGLLCVWLLVAGAKVERWRRRARAAILTPATAMEAMA